MTHRSRGNILFLILLAIILFVALTYAVNSGMRGGGKNASGEKLDLMASQIMQQGQMMEAAVARLRMTKDCKDTEISFENPVVSGYTNSGTPADGHCKVFDPAGGGLSFVFAPDEALETAGIKYYYAKMPVVGVGVLQENTDGSRCIYQGGAKANCEDLVMLIGQVQADVCELINSKLGLPAGITDNVGNLTVTNPSKFTGTYGSGGDDIGRTISSGGMGANLYAKTEGCWQQVTNGDIGKWFYYKVLITR